MTTATSAEQKGAGLRERITRYPQFPFCLGYICTNPQQLTPDVAEKFRTLSCVSYVTCPGSFSQTPEAKSEKFGDVAVNSAQTRSTTFEGETKRGVALSLVFPHLLSYLCVNLPLWVGTGPLNISPVVLSTLDFVMFYIKKHLMPLFKPDSGARNFQRLQDVYVSRACAHTSWLLTIQAICENKNRDEALKQARRKLQFDALDLMEIPGVCFELISRCLHWGPIILGNLFCKEVGMPIVPIDILVALFRADHRPSPREEEMYKHYRKIHLWLVDCINKNCFCPPNGYEQTSTFCEYISSSGLQDESESDDKVMFRTEKAQTGWNVQTEGKDKAPSVIDLLTKCILSGHKRELLEGCSFTPESIPDVIRNMLEEFSVFLPKFLEIPQFDVERFLRFFDVWSKLPFVPYKAEKDSPPPFAIKTAWYHSPRETTGAGLGVNVIQMLILGALTGEASRDLAHPSVVYAFSKGIVKSIMQRMPTAAVPPEAFIPSFNSTRNDRIILPRNSLTIEHFVRPKDTQLALSGKPSQLGNIGRFAPEDVLHMPGLCSIASYFEFSVLQCPTTFPQNYHIQYKRYYSAYNRERNRLGMLTCNGRNVLFFHYPNKHQISESVFDDRSEEEDEEIPRKKDSGKKGKARKEIEEDEDSDENEEDTSQPMEEEKSGGRGEGEAMQAEEDEEEEEGEVRMSLEVKNWQNELYSMGYILLPRIARAGACVTVADTEMGERIGVLVPPPDKENADGNFHIRQRCYYVSVANSRARNHVKMTPFQVFESLISIGTKVYLRLESATASQFMGRISLGMEDEDRERFVIQMVMCAPNVFEPEVGMAYVTYLIHGDQSSDVLCVPPSDLLIRPGRRTVIKHVFT